MGTCMKKKVDHLLANLLWSRGYYLNFPHSVPPLQAPPPLFFLASQLVLPSFPQPRHSG